MCARAYIDAEMLLQNASNVFLSMLQAVLCWLTEMRLDTKDLTQLSIQQGIQIRRLSLSNTLPSQGVIPIKPLWSTGRTTEPDLLVGWLFVQNVGAVWWEVQIQYAVL